MKRQNIKLFVVLFWAVLVSLLATNVQANPTSSLEKGQAGIAQLSYTGGGAMLKARGYGIALQQRGGGEWENLARESYAAGEFQEAAKYWQQAASAFEVKGDWLNQAIALSNLSLTYQQLGRWQEAGEAIDKSVSLLPKESQANSPAELRTLAQTFEIKGNWEWEQGQVNSALKTYEQATKIYVELKDESPQKRSLIAEVKAMQELGFYEPACKALILVIGWDNQVKSTVSNQTCEQSINEKLKDKDKDKDKLVNPNFDSIQLTGVRLMGDILRKLGYLDNSLKLLQAVEPIIIQQKSPEQTALVWLSLGNTYEALGNRNRYLPEFKDKESQNYQSALDFYQKTASITNVPAIKLQAHLNRLNLLVDPKIVDNIKYLQEIENLRLEISSQLNQLPLSRQKVYGEVSLMKSLACLNNQAMGKACRPITSGLKSEIKDKNASPLPLLNQNNVSWQEIIELGEKNVQLAKDLGDTRATAYALGNLGGIYEQKEQWLEAEQYTNKALLLSQNLTLNLPDLAYQWQWQLGRIRRDRESQDIQGAIAAYTAAFNTLQSVRNDLVPISRDGQFDFRDQIEPVYRELVDLLLREPEPSQDNLKQARNVIEGLQVAELDNFFRDACVEIKTKQIDNLDKKAAVIYPIILENWLEVIVSLPDQILHYRPPNTRREKVEEILKNLREELIKPDAPAEVPKISKILYEWLIEPFNENLRQYPNIKTLVFVLDGSLRNIPMGVLSDYDEVTQKGTYLIEKYAIALAPGLQLISPTSWQPDNLKVLMAGVSEKRDFPGRAPFSPLQYVEQELGNIKKEFPNSEKPLINQGFLKNTLRDKINSFHSSVVHIATHGEFSSDPEQTFIVAYDDVIQSKELSDILSVRREGKGNSIELLVLSACTTAKGDPRAALGLAGVAVRSGARSTLATLWYVDDESTGELMVQFYNELKKPNVNKAEALRQAQLSLLAKEPNSYYWAPFVLIGNWL